MKLITYLEDSTEKVGALTADGTDVIPLPYPNMLALIESPQDAVRAAVQNGKAHAIPLSSVTLCAPIPRPRQDVICLGINYHAHARSVVVANA